MEFIELLKEYGGWGSYTLILVGLIYAIRYLHQEKEKLKKTIETERESHMTDIKSMWAVMDKVGDWIDSKKYGQ